MVIDELIVVLGLDARQFTEGQRDALAAFKKTQEGAEQLGRGVAETGVKIGQIFNVVRASIVGAVAGLAGGEFMQMVDHINSMDAATGRWARSMDESVQGLSTWQGMIRQLGGDAGSATSALSSIQNELNNVRQGGGLYSEGFGYLLNKIGGAGNKGADQILRDLHSYFQTEISAGRETTGGAATYLRRMPGMNQDMINLILSNSEAFARYEREARKAGIATKDSADSSERYIESLNRLKLSWEGLERVITNLASPGLIEFFERTKKILIEFSNGQFISPDSWLGKMMGIKPIAEPAGAGGRASATDRESWIRSLAQSLGIDPQVAMGVARGEGFNKYSGDQGTSFGDFQLHLTPGGRGNAVGDAFRKATGLDPSDPANERAMDEFALKWAAMHGWGDFHGAARGGISQWQGIGARSSAAGRVSNNRSSSSSSSATTNIGKVEIHTQATDADGIAGDFAAAVKNSAITAPLNTGLM